MKLRYYAIKRYSLTGNSFLSDNNNYYIWKTMTNFFSVSLKRKEIQLQRFVVFVFEHHSSNLVY